MEIKRMTTETAPAARRLFNAAAENGETVCKPFEEAAFADFFLGETPGLTKVALQCEAGFAAGCRPAEGGKAYITTVAVEKNSRRRGTGRALVRAVETALAEAGPVEQYELVFFNPMNLPWLVPGTAGHEHPNAPGVDVACDGYLFFKNIGYRDFAMQNSYYLDFAGYEFPPEIRRRAEALAERGVTIEVYDPAKHSGIDEMLADLDNPLWTREIGEEARRPDRRPILVPVKDGVVAGFTGPLERQPSGRGYFAGIGVHSGYRGLGIAKVLFSALCTGLRDVGADYMTLFTGEANPARNIYEAAGFSIVRTWADMRREGK